jgi:hypothetical protein
MKTSIGIDDAQDPSHGGSPCLKKLFVHDPLLEGDGSFMLSTQPVSKCQLALLQGKAPRIRLRSGGYAVLLYQFINILAGAIVALGKILE